jgi:hypothetical protein
LHPADETQVEDPTEPKARESGLGSEKDAQPNIDEARSPTRATAIPRDKRQRLAE